MIETIVDLRIVMKEVGKSKTQNFFIYRGDVEIGLEELTSVEKEVLLDLTGEVSE